jgi:hypothetical protein
MGYTLSLNLQIQFQDSLEKVVVKTVGAIYSINYFDCSMYFILVKIVFFGFRLSVIKSVIYFKRLN